ncbi:AMP-binding protein [Pseudonocardia sichuanensis]
MKDRYPAGSTIPAHCLVPAELQPDYTAAEAYGVDDTANVGWWLSDRHVQAGAGGDVAAVHAGTGRTWTYAELARTSTALAGRLVQAGLRVGDRVALRSPNVPEALVAVVAVWKAGGVVVPTPVQARPDELAYLLSDTTASMVVVVGRQVAEDVAGVVGPDVTVLAYGPGSEESGFPVVLGSEDADEVDVELPAVPSDSVAILWHTGGTTGVPKACYHTHRRFLLGGHAVGEALEPRPGQRWSAAAPVGHALGFIYHTIFTVLHGATAVYIEDFRDPEVVLEALEKHRVTTFTAIMATWARMLETLDRSPRELPDLERGYAMWQTASSSAVRDRWLQRGIELLNNYGSTAFATWPLAPRVGDTTPPASLGRELPRYQVRAVERVDGAVRCLESGLGQMAAKGLTGLTYWNRPELQARDVVEGWTLCDDLIEFDENGNAAYLGRTDYLISSAGYKIAPGEVEQVLNEHPAVREVAVVGAPDPMRQEIVVAFVSLTGETAPSGDLARELQELVRNRVSPYKYPRRIHFVNGLPRDSVGKVRGGLLKAWAVAGSPDPSAALAQTAPNARPGGSR